MKIHIATGIYPPEIGGPAQYAKNLALVWQKEGHNVKVSVFSRFNFLPTGIRHFFYFLSILPSVSGSDFILALDTYSCAFPAVLAGKLFGKKIIIRTGGDFLWEQYVERTGDLVLLRNFYNTSLTKLNFKEKIIFKVTAFTLKKSDILVFSTSWQKDIFTPAYGLDKTKNVIVENYYGSKIASFPPESKIFIAGTRPLKWKNSERLKRAFERDAIKKAELYFDPETIPHESFIEKIQHCYAVILPTLGDVSPNTILDAVSANKPFILTRETGFYEKLKDVGLFVDPESEDDIAEKILILADEKKYREAVQKVEQFTFTHSWEDIAREFIVIFNSLK